MRRRQEAPRVQALGVAVFLSGAVLLGVEIVASRVLAPAFGSSLYVWGSLIGVVLTGLAIGYWVGGALADRYPTPYLLTGTLALGAVLVLLVPVLDGWVIEQIVAWDPGPRLDPLLAAIVLFAPLSVVLAAASPIAVRLAARSLERLGRTAGRLFSISTAGSIVGTFATAFWLVPEFGTDQVLARRRRDAARAPRRRSRSTERLLAAGRRARGRGDVAAAFAVTSLAPQQSGVSRPRELQNWSPLYRRARAAHAGGARSGRRRGAGVGLHRPRGARHALPPDVRARRRRHALPPLRQLLPERDAARRSVRRRSSPTPTTSSSASRTRPTARRVLFIGLGGGSAVKRMWRDFPELRSHAVELDPEVVRRRGALVRAAATIRGCSMTAQDGRRFLQTHERALGSDRGRRVLRRLDPVPPLDGAVLRARAVAADARRRRRVERDRRGRRRGLGAPAVDDEDLPVGLPDRGAAPGRREAAAPAT